MMARPALDHSPSRQQSWYPIRPLHQSPSHLPEAKDGFLSVPLCCPWAWEELPINTSPMSNPSCAHTAHKSLRVKQLACCVHIAGPSTISLCFPVCQLSPSCCLPSYNLIISFEAQELCSALCLRNAHYHGVLIHNWGCQVLQQQQQGPYEGKKKIIIRSHWPHCVVSGST